MRVPVVDAWDTLFLALGVVGASWLWGRIRVGRGVWVVLLLASPFAWAVWLMAVTQLGSPTTGGTFVCFLAIAALPLVSVWRLIRPVTHPHVNARRQKA